MFFSQFAFKMEKSPEIANFDNLKKLQIQSSIVKKLKKIPKKKRMHTFNLHSSESVLTKFQSNRKNYAGGVGFCPRGIFETFLNGTGGVGNFSKFFFRKILSCI